MKTFTRVAVLGAAGLLVVATPAAATDEPAPLPTYTVGHIWPLAGAAHELVRIEDDLYVFAAPEGEIRLTKTLGLVSARRGGDYVELDNRPILKWPLPPGDWGSASTGWRSSRPPEMWWARRRDHFTDTRLTWTVQGWDDVALGSTRVRALRILYQLTGSGIATREELEWEMR